VDRAGLVTEQYRDYDPIQPKGGMDWRGLLRKVWAPVAVAIAVIAKVGLPALKFGSIFIAVGGYALIWGWRFAVGFVLLILIHELGHYVEARRQGLRPSLPVFIPFLGAYVAIKDAQIGPWRHAMISIAGPVAGGLGAAAVWAAGDMTDSNFLRALAYVGFLLNLFNLIPIGILDGGQLLRSYRYLRLGGASGRALLLAGMYLAVAGLLVIGMIGSHVVQHRL
jgi:Zn-dependent protease